MSARVPEDDSLGAWEGSSIDWDSLLRHELPAEDALEALRIEYDGTLASVEVDTPLGPIDIPTASLELVTAYQLPIWTIPNWKIVVPQIIAAWLDELTWGDDD